MTSVLYSWLQASQSHPGVSGQVLTLLLEASFKGTLFLLLAGASTLVLRHASAAARHLAWTLALAVMLALPMATLTMPAWKLTIIPVPTSAPSVEAAAALVVPRSDQLRRSQPAPQVAAAASKTLAHPGWPAWLLALYVIGSLLLGIRIAVGEVRARALANRSRLLETSPVNSILEDACRHLHISRAVELRTSAEVAIPFTRGALRPTILLPEEAHCWSAKQLEFVVIHELAHVDRYDYLTQMLAQATCALYWFHPLVWLAAFEMRKERERACDDVVLSQGHPSTDYADFLLALGRRVRLDRVCPTSVAMAHSSRLEVRMKALLDPELNHRPVALGRVLLAAALAVALLLPAAAIHATAKSSTGSISGTVHDPSGAVIPGAEVTLISLETHFRIVVSTAPDGVFDLPGIPAGHYRLEVAKPGFSPAESADLELEPSGNLHQYVTMDVGPVTQQVVVSGHRPAGSFPVARKPATPKPIRVGGEIEAAHVIYQPKVIYPAGAEKRGINGTVILRAVIGKSGQILSLSPVSGPDQALIQAAMNAVRQWRYKPTLLNGVPVEVATTIEVVFRLGGQTRQTAPAQAQNASPGNSAFPKVSVQKKPAIVEAVIFRGNRRVPLAALYAQLLTHVGDTYNVNRIQHDVTALWETGYFDDLRVVADQGTSGKIITFYIREKRLIRSIDYKGLNSVTQSDMLHRFQQDKVGLGIMSQYDPAVVHRAAAVLKEMLSENGRPQARVLVRARDVPPDWVRVTFVVTEGPKVKTAGDTSSKNMTT